MPPDRSCPSGKTRYRDPPHAAQQLAKIQDNPDPQRLYMPTGYRYCPRCRGHHLTSSISRPGGRTPRRQRTR